VIFENLKLIEPILKALKNEGYTNPTPIQEKAIPVILQRKDLLGCAQTGTGKTAAFAIPILQILQKEQDIHQGRKVIRSLILTPTRELAIQIGESFTAYGKYTKVKHTVIFGGVNQKSQVDAIRAGVDVLIATPGRLLDLINQNLVKINSIELFILDEADRMLDMGFIHDVKKVITLIPAKRQTLLFSATMPSEISSLADKILNRPEKIAVTPVSSTVDTIQQSLYFVDKQDKKSLLIELLKDKTIATALVFTRTKHGADKIARFLNKAGILSDAIHGDKSQGARVRALANFKSRKTRVLVATDIAARGIDIEELSHVINYEIPNIAETYVHRIGRTGRAGLSGVAISFCDAEEKEFLKDIQKLVSKPITVIEDHQFPMSKTTAVATTSNKKPVSQAKPKTNSPTKRKRINWNRKTEGNKIHRQL
jgi:ATP-dependent RNA helicase RhlE